MGIEEWEDLVFRKGVTSPPPVDPARSVRPIPLQALRQSPQSVGAIGRPMDTNRFGVLS